MDHLGSTSRPTMDHLGSSSEVEWVWSRGVSLSSETYVSSLQTVESGIPGFKFRNINIPGGDPLHLRGSPTIPSWRILWGGRGLKVEVGGTAGPHGDRQLTLGVLLASRFLKLVDTGQVWSWSLGWLGRPLGLLRASAVDPKRAFSRLAWRPKGSHR